MGIGGMGIGGADLVVLNAMRHSEPTWCEKNNCKCPCHDEDEGDWYFPIIFLGSILAAALFSAWLIMTLCQWATPYDGPTTLVES